MTGYELNGQDSIAGRNQDISVITMSRPALVLFSEY